MTLPLVRMAARLRRILGASLIFVLLMGCASMSSTTLHSFGFDAMNDSPDILILAFKYGEARASAAHDDEADAARRGVPNARQFTGIGGYIPRGDFLYVKWRIKGTGEVLEDRVDLRSRLPSDITHHTIYFVVQQRQLIVYLISPELRALSDPRTGPNLYKYYKSAVLYPNQLRTSKR